MKDEKILSNEELMEITGGSNSFINVNNSLLNPQNINSSESRPVCYGMEPVEPIDPIAYA